jgi:3-deoxy-D-manno-octulosonic-acid transferase
LQRLPLGVAHQYVPLDTPRFAARFLDRWKPDLGLFVESDLWPNLIMACKDRSIPLAIVNGRVSPRSAQRWRHLPRTIAALLGMFDLCLAQSAGDAGRFRDLGAPRITTTGNLKLDVPEPPVDDVAMAALQNAMDGRAVVAAASTHPGEEEAMIEAHRRLRGTFSGLLTIIVPRHPERGQEIADLAAAEGLSWRMRSLGDLPEAGTDIYIADTLGELGMIYHLVPIVFMGGSLISQGGQNPIEPAKLGAAVLHGPHVWNFGEIYKALDQSGGAIPVADVGKLTVKIGAFLADPVARQTTADAAREAISALGGALNRTLAALEPYLAELRFSGQDFAEIPEFNDSLDYEDLQPLATRQTRPDIQDNHA